MARMAYHHQPCSASRVAASSRAAPAANAPSRRPTRDRNASAVMRAGTDSRGSTFSTMERPESGATAAPGSGSTPGGASATSRLRGCSRRAPRYRVTSWTNGTNAGRRGKSFHSLPRSEANSSSRPAPETCSTSAGIPSENAASTRPPVDSTGCVRENRTCPSAPGSASNTRKIGCRASLTDHPTAPPVGAGGGANAVPEPSRSAASAGSRRGPATSSRPAPAATRSASRARAGRSSPAVPSSHAAAMSSSAVAVTAAGSRCRTTKRSCSAAARSARSR